MITFKSLLENRLNYKNNKVKGLEWKPIKMPYTRIPNEEKGIKETIEKIIALALHLELPVGEWIGSATKKELPIDNITKQLLLSNITDETVHYRAFSYVAEDYLTTNNYTEDSLYLLKEWESNEYHPIEKACYAEVGVFLISLAILRIFGGQTLNNLAANVSRDEMRHVCTNKGVLSELGYDFKEQRKINKLVEDTLDWLLYDLKVPGLNKSFFMQQSKLLIRDGIAPELDSLTNGSEDSSPFEIPNYVLY